MTDLSLEVTRHIAHPPDRVFDAWLNPEMLTKFMMPMDNMSVPRASSDAKVGGRFEVVMYAEDPGAMPHAGTYVEINRPEKLVFTWESPFSQDDSTVTLTFTAKDGGTDLTLHQIRFPSEESRDNHKGGWAGILAKLDSALA